MGSAIIEALRRRLEPVGLNLFGVAAVGQYDGRVPAPLRLAPRWPAARSAVVVGSGGRAFWDAYVSSPLGIRHRSTRILGQARAVRHTQREVESGETARSERVEGRESDQGPLDRFAEDCFESGALAELGSLDPVVLYPHRFSSDPVSFVHLAECAGLGVRSLLGVLIRPDYGTWFALRAAILVGVELPLSPPLSFDPCPPCEKPCVAACPGAAVSLEHGWDVPVCAAHRLGQSACGDGCHSRLACVFGREHAYPLEARRHHQAYALEAMRARLERGGEVD